MKSYANVAGLNICFSGFDINENAFNSWRDFLVEPVTSCDLTFCNKNEKFEVSDNSYYLYPLLFSRNSKQTIVNYKTYIDDKYVDTNMVANRDWSHMNVDTTSTEAGEEVIRLMTDAAFRSRISYFSGFTVHASVIIHNGEAVIFCANKGVGKSTHAEIWKKHLDADILNGDHALIRIIDGEIIVFGAPWSGTSPYQVNSFAPLKAIVLLEQAKNNEIFLLDGLNAYLEFVTQCHLPTWDDDLVNTVLINIENTVSKLQVYKLRCNTDPGSAILVRDTIYK